MKCEITQVNGDGTIRRAVLDTTGRQDAARWERLAEQAGLDLPPTAYAPPAPTVAPVDTQAEAASKPTLFNPGYGMDAPPAAAKGRKKAFVLDPLLD